MHNLTTEELNLTNKQLLGLFVCMCIALCTIVPRNSAQNRPDNFPNYHPDNHQCSDDVYLREGGKAVANEMKSTTASHE